MELIAAGSLFRRCVRERVDTSCAPPPPNGCEMNKIETLINLVGRLGLSACLLVEQSNPWILPQPRHPSSPPPVAFQSAGIPRGDGGVETAAGLGLEFWP